MKLRFAVVPPDVVTWGTVFSVAGKLAVGVTAKGEVCRIGFLRGRKLAEVIALWRKEWPDTKFSGGAKLESLTGQPVLLTGTLFQHSVWREMAKIPAGRVATYGDLAQRIGKPKAARAVGAACGANPVPYIIPCHRVVAANGGLGGFSGGVGIKEMLLRAEGAL